MTDFEWNPRKEAENVLKHGVSFREAASAFYDTLSTIVPDPEHSVGEERYVLLSLSNQGRLLVVCHTNRGARLRLISARQASSAEVKACEI